MQNPSKRQLVYSTTNKIIFSLEESKELSKTKATLSNLRNSVGRPSAENLEGIKLLYQFCLLYTSDAADETLWV